MFQAPPGSDQVRSESETMIAGDSLTAAGRSQSLHSSDNLREPNPQRAKEGRKVECENDQKRET
jgi:hypothetical protein